MKERLTDAAEADVHVTLSYGQKLHLRLTRAEFEGFTANLIQKTLGPTRKALRDAKLTPADIDGVVLVGGATRMDRAISSALSGRRVDDLPAQ